MTQFEKELATPEIQEFVNDKLLELRKRLLDFTRRNPLINTQFRATSTSILRVVDELPDILRFNLTNGNPMRLVSLPALEEELPDEQTDNFLNALYLARKEDKEYLVEVSKIDSSTDKFEENLLLLERKLKDRLREQFKLPKRQTRDDLSLSQHAKIHGIAPSYVLPLPEDEHEDGRHQDTDIQTLFLPEKLARVAKGIQEKGRSFERETGVNVLHAAFGLLEWKDPAERASFVSPLLLLEIRVERKQSPRGAQFYVSGVDKVFVNKTLEQKLFVEHRLSIPEYEGGSVEDYFHKIEEGAPKGWDWKVRREAVFGIFPSSKIAMYHDLDPENRPISENTVVARLMASSSGGDNSYAEDYETDDPEISKKVPYLVMDADASQYSALVDIANGQNLSIEGPPGSGKSQTIVNLIAAALADNKKVLFVAEKLTALEVVKSRLEATGLGEFILPLQAGRGTRKNIYENLGQRIALGRSPERSLKDFNSQQNVLERRRQVLQAYLDVLGLPFGGTGMTVYQAIGYGIATAEIRESIPKDIRRIRLNTPEKLGRDAVEMIQTDAGAFAEKLNNLNRIPKLWLDSNAVMISQDDAEDASEAAGNLAIEIEAYVSEVSNSELAPLIASSPFEVDLNEVQELLKEVSDGANRIDPVFVETLTQSKERLSVQTLCNQVLELQSANRRLTFLTTRLTAELSGKEQKLSSKLKSIREDLSSAGKHDLEKIRTTMRRITNSGVFRIFTTEYKNARDFYRNVLGGAVRDNRIAIALKLDVYATWLEERQSFENDVRFKRVFGDLFQGLEADIYEITKAIDISESENLDDLIITNAETEEILNLRIQINELTDLINSSAASSIIGNRFNNIYAQVEILQAECSLAETITNALEPSYAISILRSGSASDLLNELVIIQDKRRNIEKLSVDLSTQLKLPVEMGFATEFNERLGDLKTAAADAGSLLSRAQFRRTEDTFREHGFDTLVDWVISEGENFDGERLGPIVQAIIAKNIVDCAYDKHSSALQGYDGQEFDRIRKEIADKDRQLIQLSRKVIRNQLLTKAKPPAGNSIGKKSTYTNMSLIINEMNKKRNQIGVRELTRRAGQALLELKPCWMMSPLAVAQYLHDDMEFDLVVIDEASQMTPENAIGAISRAKQSVIVGDAKQLPPTSFFQKMLDDSDTDEDLREDSESILDMANTSFKPVRQLRWHYRSRHSGLIQFSNQNMYKGELTIFPSPQEEHPDYGVELVEVSGVYKSRRNEIEAQAVVAAAVLHMEQTPEVSLGICTMNTDQKDLILEEFERERDRNPKVQAYIAYWEQENDALEEFFIKNLETIQGDERDVMFISTLYGPETPNGRVLQRFGPINSVHGHRRLNVLFTRAKRKMVTFTSLKPTDIIVDGAKNFGVKMFRNWLEYCRTGYVAELNQTHDETESPFEDYVAQQIERMGCSVEPQVGVAGFRIDLGVRHPEWPYGYLLGVECDGATYHSSKSSRDRDRLRQEVLEGLGWRLHRIWSTDWFRNPQVEIESLRKAIDIALDKVKKTGSAPQDPPRTPHTIENVSTELMHADAPREEPGRIAPTKPSQTNLPLELNEDDLFKQTVQGANDTMITLGAMQETVEPIVSVGSKVRLESLSDDGKKFAFKLVKGENDPDQGLIGIHTPLGSALIDAQVGDEVEYQIGSHIKEVRVMEIS